MPATRPHPTTERPVDAPLLTFDTSKLLKQIKSEEAYLKGGRNAITLLKAEGMRIVLIAMHAGTVFQEHQANGPISLQVLEGQVRFRTKVVSHTLSKGQIVHCKAKLRHDVEALEDSVSLLTIAV